MITCREVSQEMWIRAFQALVLFFRHHGVADPKDLAQDTLVRVLARDDTYPFEKAEDFPKICHGFAKYVLLEHKRKQRRGAADALDADVPAPNYQAGGKKSIESRIFLEQVCHIGQTQLEEKEWEIIRQGAKFDRSVIAENLRMGTANSVRVKLHRARHKLARLAGLSKGEV